LFLFQVPERLSTPRAKNAQASSSLKKRNIDFVDAISRLRASRVIATLLCISPTMLHFLARVAIFCIKGMSCIFWTYVWTNCIYINTWIFIYLCLWIPLIIYMYMCMTVNVYKDNSKTTFILYLITMLNNLTNCQITMLNNLNITYQITICGHKFFYLWLYSCIYFRLW